MATATKRDLDAAVERLRASKKRSDERELALGREAGAAWATNAAEAVELRRLQFFYDACRADDWDSFFDSGTGIDSYGVGERLFSVITAGEGDRNDGGRFWESIFGDGRQYPADAECRGFAEGALEIWDEVKDQL